MATSFSSKLSKFRMRSTLVRVAGLLVATALGCTEFKDNLKGDAGSIGQSAGATGSAGTAGSAETPGSGAGATGQAGAASTPPKAGASGGGGAAVPPKDGGVPDAGVLPRDMGPLPADTGPAPSGNGCDRMADVCTIYSTCSPSLFKLGFGTLAACKELLTTACLTGAQLPGANITDARVSACVAAYNKASCSQVWSDQTLPECDFAGTRANGAACLDSVQCQSGLCTGQEGACGTCSPRVAAGGTCVDTDSCRAGLTCTNETCIAVVGVNQACGDAAECATGYLCSSNHTCVAAAGKKGDLCFPDADDCNLFAGLYCNVFTETCQSFIVATEEQSCDVVDDVILCQGGSTCVPTNAAATARVCRADGVAGDTCGTDIRDCQYPLLCLGGTCKLSTLKCP